jgi:hypothetical protein
MEVPREFFDLSSKNSRTCYPSRTTNQKLTNDLWVVTEGHCGVFPVKGWVESPMLGCVTRGSSPSGEPDDEVICIDRKCYVA